MDLFELDMFGCATTAIMALLSIIGALAYFQGHHTNDSGNGHRISVGRVPLGARPFRGR